MVDNTGLFLKFKSSFGEAISFWRSNLPFGEAISFSEATPFSEGELLRRLYLIAVNK